MQDPQEIFDEIQEKKKRKKEIAKIFRDTLSQDSEYQENEEKLKELREKQKAIKLRVQEELGETWTEHEALTMELKDLEQILTDVILSSIMEGQSIQVRDQWDTLYEPVYKIVLKKAK